MSNIRGFLENWRIFSEKLGCPAVRALTKALFIGLLRSSGFFEISKEK
jgi:hypothetical protein